MREGAELLVHSKPSPATVDDHSSLDWPHLCSGLEIQKAYNSVCVGGGRVVSLGVSVCVCEYAFNQVQFFSLTIPFSVSLSHTLTHVHVCTYTHM